MFSEQQNSKLEEVWGKIPRVLIGCPEYEKKDYSIERWAERVKELDYPNYEVLVADNSEDQEHIKVWEKLGIRAVWTGHQDTARDRLTQSREYLRKYALENGFDFFFDLESDIIPTKDIIYELLKWGKKVIGGWYYIGLPNFARPCLSRVFMEVDHPDLKLTLFEYMAKHRLMKVFMGSMGVLMMHRDVLEQVPFYYIPVMYRMDDTFYFIELERRGIDVYIDTDLLVAHFTGDWRKVEDF